MVGRAYYMFLKMNLCVLAGLFYCVFIAIVVSGSSCSNICEWLSWEASSCTVTCGGGTVYRTRKLCCPLNVSYSDCVKYCNKNYNDYRDSVTCNEMCYNGGSYYSGSCHCLPEYDGRCCLDKYDECVSSPCLNGGACRQGSDRFDCTCLPGYIGTSCEYDYNECSSNPCGNGGICTDRVDEYNCSCVAGYVGVNCEIVASTSSSHGLPVAGIAGGISAGVVIILVVLIGIILWRRYQHTKKNQHENDVTGEDEQRTRKNQINDVSVKQDVIRGNEYEGLNFTNAEATQHLQLNDISLEKNTDPKARSPEGESYENFHPYVNSDMEMYSSLKIPKTDKDAETIYENTWIKQLD